MVYIGDGENTLGGPAGPAKELADCLRDAKACLCGVIVSGSKQADRPEQALAAVPPLAARRSARATTAGRWNRRPAPAAG